MTKQQCLDRIGAPEGRACHLFTRAPAEMHPEVGDVIRPLAQGRARLRLDSQPTTIQRVALMVDGEMNRLDTVRASVR